MSRVVTDNGDLSRLRGQIYAFLKCNEIEHMGFLHFG